MNKNEKNVIIKNENKKALIRFVPILIGAALVGGLFGALSTTGGMQDFAGKAAGILVDIGCLPTIVVSIIWLVTQCAYLIEAFRLEHGSDTK